jgi:ApaG protein
MNVQGEGVVGEFPILEPGESFEYTSGTPLKNNKRYNAGFLFMSQNNGEPLKLIYLLFH